MSSVQPVTEKGIIYGCCYRSHGEPIFPGKVVSVLGVSGGIVRVCGKAKGRIWPIVHAQLENWVDVVSVVPPSSVTAVNKWRAYIIP